MEQVTNDEFYVKLGSILRELREQKGLTQQEVALQHFCNGVATNDHVAPVW